MIALSAADCSVTKGQHRKVRCRDGGSYRKGVPNRVFHLEPGAALVMSKIPNRMVAADALVRRGPDDDDDEDDEEQPKEDEDDEDEGDEGDGYSE